MVHPSTARSIMTEQLRQTPSSKLKPSAANYEFAREMLMFPLSVKNPGVPMVNVIYIESSYRSIDWRGRQ
jgi:hypothetical protein